MAGRLGSWSPRALFLGTLLSGACADVPANEDGASDPQVESEQSALVILTLEQQLGSSLYNDKNLSSPAGQSCASCHTPSAGFADPDSQYATSEGVIAGRFGARNAPTAA